MDFNFSKNGKLIRTSIFATVFQRILDFKTGLDFYPGPLFYFRLYGNG